MWRATITAAILLLMTACTSGDGTEAEALAPDTSETTTAPDPTLADPAVPTDPAAVLADCTPVTAEDIQAIEAALTEPATLVDAYTTTHAGYRYVMANVDRPDGTRLTSADIWVIDHTGNLHAGTSSAVEYSNLPDAETLPGADRYGNTDQVRALTSCVIASARQRNTGG